LHLIQSTAEFKIGGVSRAGFPILLWENMNSCTAANTFLRHYLMRGQAGSKRSWEPISRSMYDYFGFLEAQGLPWDHVEPTEDRNLVEAYRDYCFDVANLKRNTVRLRVGYVCEFYKFALARSWIPSLPFSYEVRHVAPQGGFLAHTDASGGAVHVASPMPRKHKELIKFLTMDEVRTLLGAVERNRHHHMMIRLAVHTGLRREELATFPLAYVIDPDRRGTKERNMRVTLDPQDSSGMRTKGDKARIIYLPTRLMRDLHHYVVHWRSARASLTDQNYPQLFLNQLGEPWAANGKGIERMVSTAGGRVGIKAHPHMLRHTYATQTLVALQRQRGDTRVEPLVFLQKQLGHASIQTTTLYLHLVNELADNAVLAYDDELNDWEQ
jgi:integrase/recombinase XerD